MYLMYSSTCDLTSFCKTIFSDEDATLVDVVVVAAASVFLEEEEELFFFFRFFVVSEVVVALSASAPSIPSLLFLDLFLVVVAVVVAVAVATSSSTTMGSSLVFLFCSLLVSFVGTMLL